MSILVITTKKEPSIQESGKEEAYPIYRKLHGKAGKMSLIDRMTTRRITHSLGLLLAFIREISHDMRDLKTIDRLKIQFQPDVIYLGHILPLTRTLMPYLADDKTPIVFDEGGIRVNDLTREEKGIWFRFH